MYVEDTIIYFSDASAEIIKQVLQNDLNHVEQWLASNRPVLNQSKTKWKLFGTTETRTTVHTTTYNFTGKKLTEYQALLLRG